MGKHAYNALDRHLENSVTLGDGDALGMMEHPPGNWWLYVTDGESGGDCVRIYNASATQLAALFVQIGRRFDLLPTARLDQLRRLRDALTAVLDSGLEGDCRKAVGQLPPEPAGPIQPPA